VFFTWGGADGAPMFDFGEQSRLTIQLIDGRLAVSTDVRDRCGDLVAEIVRNEWKIAPPPRTWDRNYTDNALEVKSPRGRIVLQVQLYRDIVRIQGEWRTLNGRGTRLAKCIHPATGAPGGCVIVITPTFDPDDPVIKPIFAYPSESHFGELVANPSN
jgi:hypothetical protein